MRNPKRTSFVSREQIDQAERVKRKIVSLDSSFTVGRRERPLPVAI